MSDFYAVIIPVKALCFGPKASVDLPVCVCVCHQVCDKMAGLSNMALSEAITIDNSSRMNHYQNYPNPDPNLVDRLI